MNRDAEPKTIDDLRECLFAKERPGGYRDGSDAEIIGHAIQHIQDMRRALREFGMSYDTGDLHWYGGKIYDWWEETAERCARYTSTRLGYDSNRMEQVERDGNTWILGKSKVTQKTPIAYALHEPAAIGDPDDVIDLLVLLQMVLGRMFTDCGPDQ